MKIKSIDCDAGTQFQEACLSADRVLSFELNQLNTKSQYQNYSESKYRLFSELYKKLFAKNRASPGKYSLLITPCDFGRLIDCLVLSINSIPYARSNGILGPYMNKYPASIISMINEEDFMSGDQTTKFGQYLQTLFQIRNDVLKENIQTRAQVNEHTWHDGRNKYVKIKPSVGDLVIHQRGASFKMCIIIKIIDKNQCLLRQGSKEFVANIVNLEIVALANDTF